MTSGTIGAFEQFLQWGPLGLAGLMLVLVIFAVVTRELTAEHTSLLKTFMYVGAACFIAALFAQYMTSEGRHKLVVQVLPNDLDGLDFPPPKITANGQDVDRANELFISQSTALSIDVTRAVDALQTTTGRADSAEQLAAQTQDQLATVSAQAERDIAAAEQMTLALQEQNAAQTAALEEARVIISDQNSSLEQALTASATLQEQVQTLSATVAFAPEPSAVELMRIERSIQSLQREIQGGIMR